MLQTTFRHQLSLDGPQSLTKDSGMMTVSGKIKKETDDCRKLAPTFQRWQNCGQALYAAS